MHSARAGILLSYLAQVPESRGRNGRRHPRSAMLTAVGSSRITVLLPTPEKPSAASPLFPPFQQPSGSYL